MARTRHREHRGQRDWYQLNRWRKIAKAQLAREPLCCMCFAVGKITAATIADHIEDHHGNWYAFWTGALQ